MQCGTGSKANSPSLKGEIGKKRVADPKANIKSQGLRIIFHQILSLLGPLGYGNDLLCTLGYTCPHGFAAGNPHGNPHWLNLHACSCLSLELHTRGSADLGSWEKPYPRGSIAHFPGMDSLQ